MAKIITKAQADKARKVLADYAIQETKAGAKATGKAIKKGAKASSKVIKKEAKVVGKKVVAGSKKAFSKFSSFMKSKK